jgi:uncharacterized protein (DUF433 family)
MREAGLPASAQYERFIDEGLRHDEHPLIVFRDGAGGRRPALAGTRLDVVQVMDTVLAAGARGDDAVREAADYLGIPEAHVRACVRYYAALQDEVDAWRERMVAEAEREREAWQREQAVLA